MIELRILKFPRPGAATIALTMLVAPAFAQQNVPALPGGASSLQETYQDWSLSCQTSASSVVCAVSQQQTQQNGQRILGVELTHNNNTLAGNLILPFGLLLDAGATLQIDDGQPLEPQRFSTCLPAGCIVQLSCDGQTVSALRAGSVLKIKVTSTDQRDLTLSVSLKGLAPALDRLKALGNS